MPMEFHQPAFKKIRKLGMLPLTSIYDPRDLDFLEKLDCSIYKISSFEMTYFDLLRAVAQTGKDIILSTGMSSIEEIKKSLDVIRKENSKPTVTLMHCISAYPTPTENSNLNSIKTMKETFGLNIGFSDHTLGSEAAILAYALGATSIEKHITNDCRRKGPDHRFSAEFSTLKDIVDGIKRTKILGGSGKKWITQIEKRNKIMGRRSAFTTRIIEKGEIISKENFRFVRPGVGIPANSDKNIIGRKLNKKLGKGYPITWDDLDNP